ncbi:hypothetical protein L6164_013182 [Bauhinia variegata]|uniref:Uncharacterized protein n=1 Tax=Bauhinia variegata TaxID=167791 RepID=A0ACB9PHR3_BAUVA|nr:hypothetical protein L6164_013182 [Bauhinia variegata]
MAISIPFFLLLLALYFQYCSSSSYSQVLSLSVGKPEDVIVSKNGLFSAGFQAIGENAYCFTIWFAQPDHQNPTIVWMANRDQPVNGIRSTLSLIKLFDFPTNTLLPGQNLTRSIKLVSSRSETNQSSGFYKLFYDNDNILRLLYDGPDFSSTYWPDPGKSLWDAGRSTYNGSRVAVLDALGYFVSSHNYNFRTSDYGLVLQRRLTLDSDRNLRVYSREQDANECGVEEPHGRLVTWVREKRNQRFEMASWVEEIIAPVIEANYDINIMETLASVALDCVEEDRDSRPTMSQVVELLQSIDNDS